MVSVANKNQGTDFLIGQAYQARYNIKMDKNNIFDYMFNFFGSDKVVEITKRNHLPIILLNKKFVLPHQA